MHRAPALEPNADRADLPRVRPRRVDPDTRVLGEPPGVDAERGERVDHELLDVADVAERAELVDDRQDRVADELTRAVVGDVAAAAHRDEVGADRGGVAPQVGVEVGPRPVREHVRVLEQQEMVLPPVREQRFLDGQRLAVRNRPPTRNVSSHRTGVPAVVRRVPGVPPDLGSRNTRMCVRQNSPDQSLVSRISLSASEEAGGVGAVERAVVPGHREVADRVDDDRLGAVGQRGDDRLAHDRVGRQDRDLRLVDDREREHRTGRPVVRDRERAARDLVGKQLLRPGTRRQIVDLPGDGAQALALRTADDRHDEALVVEVDSDAEIDEAVDDELVVRDARIEVRELLERIDDGPADERQVREAEALGGLPSRLLLAAGEVDVVVVDLDDAEGVRAGGLRRRHRRARELADLGELDDLVAVAPAVATGADGAGAARSRSRRPPAQAAARRPGPRRRRGRAPAAAVPAEPVPAAGAAAAAAAAGRAAGAPAEMPSMWRSTSSRVIRPPGPLPVIVAGSSPCSFTSRRTTGDSSTPAAFPVGADSAAVARPARAPARGRRVRDRGLLGRLRLRCRRRGGAGAPRPARGSGCGGPAAAAGSALPRLGAALGSAGAASSAARVLGRRCLRGRRRGGSRCRAGVADDRDDRADIDRLALGHADLGQHARDRRRHLGVDLVRRHLEQRLVGGDRVADGLEPLRDGSLGHRFTELGKRDISHGAFLFVHVSIPGHVLSR